MYRRLWFSSALNQLKGRAGASSCGSTSSHDRVEGHVLSVENRLRPTSHGELLIDLAGDAGNER